MFLVFVACTYICMYNFDLVLAGRFCVKVFLIFVVFGFSPGSCVSPGCISDVSGFVLKL